MTDQEEQEVLNQELALTIGAMASTIEKIAFAFVDLKKRVEVIEKAEQFRLEHE